MTDFRASDPGVPGASPTNAQPGGAATPPNPDSGDNQVLLEIEGRRYTKADLVKKITSADTHIERLTAERAEDRKLLQETAELLKKQVTGAELLRQAQANNQPADPPAAQPSPQAPPVGMSAAEVAEHVRKELAQAELVKQRNENWQLVTTRLTAAYGDAVNARVAEVAKDNGLTVEEIAEMIRSRPKVALKLFPGVAVEGKASPIPGSTVNSQAFNRGPKGPSGITKAAGTKAAISIYRQRLEELGLTQ